MIFPESDGDSGLCCVGTVNVVIFLNFISGTKTGPEAGGVLARVGPDNPRAQCDYQSPDDLHGDSFLVWSASSILTNRKLLVRLPQCSGSY